LTSLQPHLRRSRDEKTTTLAVVAMLCLALLALLTVARVVHTHPNPGDADHCLLCVTTHSVAPAAAAVAVVLSTGSWTPAPVYKTRAIKRFWQPQLFTRPPPVSS
jgi:hypothetical protein